MPVLVSVFIFGSSSAMQGRGRKRPRARASGSLPTLGLGAAPTPAISEAQSAGGALGQAASRPAAALGGPQASVSLGAAPVGGSAPASSRADLPAARPRGRGGLDSHWRPSEAEREECLRAYDADKVARTSVAPRDSLLRTRRRPLEQRHDGPAPAAPCEPADIRQVGALMKAGGYRSLANYVSRIKLEHVAAGYYWSQQYELEARQGTSSTTRGQGPPLQ